MAGLGWIHFSETTRRQVLRIIDILGESGTIDELGIGVVRNAFSNEMFSGISTIMTRARYYYFVPYLIIDYLREKQKLPIDTYMKNAEMDLMEGLTRKYDNPEKERIIGYTIAQRNIAINKRVNELVRKPSEIYWGGIREYGLFKKPFSFGQLCDAINKGNYIKRPKDNRGNNDESGDDDTRYEKWAELFDVPYHNDWDKLEMSLTREEAEHLHKHITESSKGKFLAEIMNDRQYTSEFIAMKSFNDMLDSGLYKELSTHSQKVIKTAVQFWELLEGAHIRFNILLQSKPSQAISVPFQSDWEEWTDRVMDKFNWTDFDSEFLWQIVVSHSRINWQTRDFIINWFDAVERKKEVSELDILVKKQEKNNKKDRSKLLETHTNSYNGWIGIDGLEYRLRNVQTIVRDIAAPLDMIEYA